jgi:hypothetical protein
LTATRSNDANPVGDQVKIAIVDFDQTFADAKATRGSSEYIPAIFTAMNLYQTLNVRNARTQPESTPVILAGVDFNQTFVEAIAMSPRNNTPFNREKLRNAGWIRIIGSR